MAAEESPPLWVSGRKESPQKVIYSSSLDESDEWKELVLCVQTGNVWVKDDLGGEGVANLLEVGISYLEKNFKSVQCGF